MKISKQLCGIAGEYYAAAEISRRGFLAAITLRNSDGVDILVSNIEGDKLFSIQVKTTQSKLKWILNKKVENDKSENKYFAFVNITGDVKKLPDYYIVKSTIVADRIYNGHKNWLNEPGKNGKKRNDSDVRQFDPKYYSKEELLDWDSLIEIIQNSNIS